MTPRRSLPLLFSVALVAAACTDDAAAPDGGTAPDVDAGALPDAADAPDSGDTPDSGDAPDSGTTPDTGEAPDSGDAGGFSPPEYDRWTKWEPEGAACANGSQYKFFVKFSQTSSNVIIYLEGGGACWDYASCTGTGVRTAANRDGIPDTHATNYANLEGLSFGVDTVYPLLNSDLAVSPMADWNKVFIPYCTGDVFSGDRVVTYEDPAGTAAPVEFHHVGHANIMKTIGMLTEMFPQIPKMFVGGCSAGGAGAVINYHFFRSGLNVGTGYMLNDSGPIFPDQELTSRSLPLHDRVRSSWNVDPLLAAAPQAQALSGDFGALSRILSEEYPNDRLAHTHFRLDYNYSLYSYERFWDVDPMNVIGPFGDGTGLGGLGLEEEVPRDRAAVYSLWWDDTALMRAQYDSKPNLAYYMPFYRDTNDSHCLTIPGIGEFPQEELVNVFFGDFPRLAWAGTDLSTKAGPMNVRDFVDHLIDETQPLESYFEEDGEGRFLACTPDPRYFDAAACGFGE
jgi:hypothetical protein